MRVVVAGCLLLVFILLAIFFSVSAVCEEGLREVRILNPLSEVLSGRVWLSLSGMEEEFAAAHPLSVKPSQLSLIPIPSRTPSPLFSRNLIVTMDIGRRPYQNEPHLAVNPRNPQNIILASHDYDIYCMGVYFSMDGGESWGGPIISKPLPRDDYCSDPVIAFDGEGMAYFTYLSIGERVVNLGRVIAVVEELKVAVSKSEDGGETWSEPTLAAWGDIKITVNGVWITSPDKPWISVGPNPKNSSRENIYITYTEFAAYFPFTDAYPYLGVPTINVTIKLVKSEDGGKTWSKPISISPTYTYTAGEIGHKGIKYGRIVQGSFPAVTPNGTVYVAYYDSLDDGAFRGQFAPTIVWSNDGGETWSEPVKINVMDELDYALRPTLFRAWSSMFPQLSISPTGDQIYVVFAANPSGPDDSNIYFSRSLDGGKTWSLPKRLNDDDTACDQFFPAMAVDEEGKIHVIWGDRRDDPKDIQYHIYYTYSADGGENFSENKRVSDYPSNPSFGIPVFIGDYFTVAAAGGDVYIAWTDSRTGQKDYPNQDIAFARRRPIPAPTITLEPVEGPAGQGVDLRGRYFARGGRPVLIQVDEVEVGFTFTDAEGEFSAKLFIPFMEEGKHVVKAIDILGNSAESEFRVNFGFDTLQRQMKESQTSLKPVAQDVEELRENFSALSREIRLLFLISMAILIVALTSFLRRGK